MRLKSLELQGFKSFADRTSFQFGVDTLTGVVGPNGCGKSNVVDAARWVLGEQRPTSMRGKEMTDVIFKGCASRPGVGMAEVTIVLDNASGAIGERGSEVQITRRVYKSGEGEYLIDGQHVRLKDVREMLFDTGLGSRGYSVLEQGRIDAVLSANPIDRRRIFEEAAGISRYRQRKHETELRLARTEQDLSRVDDLLGELRSRERSLKVQAGKAERYLAARGEWTRERRRLTDHQLFALSGDIQRCAQEIAATEATLAELRAGRESAEAEIASLEATRSGLAKEVGRLAAEASRLEGDGRALSERRHQLAARVASWERTAADEEQRGQELDAELDARRAELASWATEKAELEREVERARKAAELQARGRRELHQRYHAVRQAVEAQNARVLELLHERTEAANNLRHLELARGPLAERAARIEERLGAARAAAEGVRAEEREAALGHERASEALAAAERERNELQARLRGLESELAALDAERQKNALERARLASRIESLLDREREIESLDAGSRAVLEAARESRGPLAPQRVLGLVADHLRTSTLYARALDAVLGERARALVISDPMTALAVAQWLGGDAQVEGQAALTVACGFGPPERDAKPHVPSRLAERVLGTLREQVECDEGYEQLVELLCENVLVVADVEAALELVRRSPSLRCVTPAGELVDGAGLIGGERTLVQGAIGRRSSAAELSGEVAALEERARSLEARLAELQGERTQAREALAAVEGSLAERREVAGDAQSRLATARGRRADLEGSLELYERETEGSLAEREKLERDLASAALRREQTQAAFEAENAVLQERERERLAVEEERDRQGREEGRAQIDLTRIQEQSGGLARRIADLERVIASSAAEAERARRLAREATESARAGVAERDELARRDELLAKEREGLEGELAQARARAGAAERALEAARGGREERIVAHERTSAELAEERLVEQRLALSREEVVRRAREELELAEEELAPERFVEGGFAPEDDLLRPGAIEALDRRVRELKQELDRIGPVNTEALSELEEISQRLSFLDTQSDDLRNARKALNETLARIEEESERLFLHTFEEVRVNFQRIFRQLFGGGRADVKLAEGEPVLEAGVEISARPPGREMLPIGLLSGGQRTMTALALLFAVFEARPSPFCILDEVDAALDDANIQRFLAMLDGFRRSTQFVVVTHNKGTMAACESLYGVTMQVKGVSRQVSVQLDEVDAFVPEATGKPEGTNGEAQNGSHGASRARRAALLLDEMDDDELEPERSEPPLVDPESGEPVVELQPASPDARLAPSSEGRE